MTFSSPEYRLTTSLNKIDSAFSSLCRSHSCIYGRQSITSTGGAKRYSPLEKDCETITCQGFVGFELTKCKRKCISQFCYNELYAWDEANFVIAIKKQFYCFCLKLEQGEIDVRLTSFKGCVVKQLQDQESKKRG
ncbi:hypothetical protein pdam_00016176 [Pocillopora damicornis]|uniref:Uncharacterized protein n=1 Tax=Pocillopora damicornis TaxID=46731 RepID=A0A3M6UNQ3_POCDA|nr:hypothetical protein pdam_00016176 [Pocillopora damicornis]